MEIKTVKIDKNQQGPKKGKGPEKNLTRKKLSHKWRMTNERH